MGIAKAINKMRGGFVINGAAVYLLLAAAFITWAGYLASQSNLPPGPRGYVFGHTIGPALIVGAAALYYFFKFRSEKAHHIHVQKLRQTRSQAES
ncbi:hypothetical protein PAGU2638_28300 [Lysobacter sp. PAGU 2638]